ncbi:aspartate/glutamate racemase family protein [Mesorhizobium qingshengii]|uniref:Aspartate/glutamate racemase n=1 Tax=Mesorhizobium qingshengii TaxID=1165689 RepID=A0A1G5Z920_9HYPH|nr:aspartate/glutamate racemase family protein [Mesorhizobium qingshengii]SDA91274.1 Aspartate/glutamate racemase [Mesorhizobium qingshengii]
MVEKPASNIKPTKIGLVGGLAIRAGVFYYDKILERYNDAKIPLHLTLRHADVNTVLGYISSANRAGLGSYLGSLANELFDAGVDTVAITAVAPHLAIDDIKKSSRGPIINVLESIEGGLKAAGLERVAIFGNRAVMASDIFGSVPERMVVKLDPKEINVVHDTYNDIALYGKRGTKAEVEYFRHLANDLIIKRGAQAIVLAGTDLSSFYAEQKPEFPFLDVAELHINQILAGI